MPCAEYYDLLTRVRLEGDWEEWLTFFAEGVLETAQTSVETAQRMVRIGMEDTARIQTLGRLGEAGLVTELTGRRRNWVFCYSRYLERY